MTLQAPENVTTTFVINYYKDMEMADEIEFSNSYSNYKKALKDYEEEVQKANKEYFIELVLEIETKYKEETQYESITLAHNEPKKTYDLSNISKGDEVLIKSVEDYKEENDEVTELIEMFAGKVLEVLSVSEDANEWGEHTILASHRELGTCTFTEHEIEAIVKE